MDLVIDIGNTLQKLAVFSEKSVLLDFFSEKNLSISLLETLFSQYPIKHTIVSSVREDDDLVLHWLENNYQHRRRNNLAGGRLLLVVVGGQSRRQSLRRVPQWQCLVGPWPRELRLPSPCLPRVRSLLRRHPGRGHRGCRQVDHPCRG